MVDHEQFHERGLSVPRELQQRGSDDAAADWQGGAGQQQFHDGESAQTVGVEEDRKVGTGQTEAPNDVIGQDLQGGTAPGTAGVAEPGHVDEEHFELVCGPEVGDLAEAS